VILSWRVVGLDELARLVVERCGPTRPAIVAVNGHSSSGKTTLAGRLAARLPAAAVLQTDDLAWHQGVFAWDTLLHEDVLPVVRAGEPLDYRPPQWQARSRDGSITLPGALDFLLVEGVGASQASVRSAYDAVLWVETDEPTRLARDVPRLAAGGMSPADYASWMAEENAYVTRERPWEHADLVVYGGDSIPHDPDREAVIADP
jgi:uridine kinase